MFFLFKSTNQLIFGSSIHSPVNIRKKHKRKGGHKQMDYSLRQLPRMNKPYGSIKNKDWLFSENTIQIQWSINHTINTNMQSSRSQLNSFQTYHNGYNHAPTRQPLMHSSTPHSNNTCIWRTKVDTTTPPLGIPYWIQPRLHEANHHLSAHYQLRSTHPSILSFNQFNTCII